MDPIFTSVSTWYVQIFIYIITGWQVYAWADCRPDNKLNVPYNLIGVYMEVHMYLKQIIANPSCDLH